MVPYATDSEAVIVSPPPPSDDVDTLRQLDDTSHLVYPPLDQHACERLEKAGLVSEEAGWWRITALGRLALATAALTARDRPLGQS